MDEPQQTPGFSPFAEEVNAGDYARATINPNAPPIPEPIFEAPDLNAVPPKADTSVSEDGPAKTERPPVNPAMNELPKNEQKKASEALAEVAFDGYQKLWNLAGNIGKFSKKTLAKKIADGDIDPDLVIPVAPGTELSVMEFADAINAEVDKAMLVTEGFKEKVRPILINILQKHNAGLTDEQLVGYYLFQDGAQKIAQLVATRSVVKDSMNQMVAVSNVNSHYGHSSENTAHAHTPNPPPENPNPDNTQFSKPEPKNTPPEDARQFSTPNEFSEPGEKEFNAENAIPKFEENSFAPAGSQPAGPDFGNLHDLDALNRAAELNRQMEKTKNQGTKPTAKKTTKKTKK